MVKINFSYEKQLGKLFKTLSTLHPRIKFTAEGSHESIIFKM